MFHLNEIRPTKASILFLKDLTEVLAKHQVTILYGKSHVEFHHADKVSPFAQCFCANGGSYRTQLYKTFPEDFLK